MQLPIHYTPRPYQREALVQLDLGCVMNVWVWARRGGKDMTAFAWASKKMIEKPMNVVLVYPTKEQGKNAFWENIENDGFKTIDRIPRNLASSWDNANMRIVLKNGSTFQILGATDEDALRGANGKIYIFSEFVDIRSAALEVIRPIIAVNGGQIIIQSTPKIDGISGGTFKILYDRALATKKQYASLVTADQYLDAETLEDLRQESIAKYGNDFWWRQEYMCDWGQTSHTSYYGPALTALGETGRIGPFPYDKRFPAYSAWDLGMSDSTAITFFQYINKRPRIIDYHETHDIASEPIVHFVMSKPYNLQWHFLPHDANVRDSDAVERINKMRDYGLINSSLLKKEGKEDGIQRAVENIIKAEINAATTVELRRKLMLYKRKYNEFTGDYEGPEHKTESHAADSVRYMFAAIEQDFNPKTGEFLYSPENSQDTYDTDDLEVASQYRPNYF